MGSEGAPTTKRGARGNAHRVPALDEIEALVGSLVGMVRGGGISELDVAVGRVSIRLRGAAVAAAPTAVEVAVVSAAEEAVVTAATPEHVITAPMIGTFYASPSPGEPPFVEVGDPIEAGQVIGIIEAMKIMNEITADRPGVVSAILVSNAQPVEYGSPLLRLQLADNGTP